MNSEPNNDRRLHRVLWIVLACFVVTLLISVGLLMLWWRGRPSPRTVTVSPPPRTSSATSFADLTGAEVAGRYKIDDAGKVMYLFLNEDHSFINQDGTTYPPYEWQALPDRLIITWQRSSSTFTKFEQPGIYSQKRADGGLVRMMKLPDLPPADAMAFAERDVVAWLSFTNGLQSSGLALANTNGDGSLQPGEAGGVACYQLTRQQSRMSSFLYGRIAPELKTPPFTNAFVVVEYFDRPTNDPRNGWITLQFDAPDAPYTSTAQRVQLGGTLQWKRATFVLDAPTFEGRENDGADFRLCLAGSRLDIRSLKLVKNRPVPAVNRAASR